MNLKTTPRTETGASSVSPAEKPRPTTPADPPVRTGYRRNGTSTGSGDTIDTASRVPAISLSSQKTELDPIEILLVDDTPEKLLALEAALGDMGQTLVRAESGSEALRLVLRRDFAVILLDINMPGMDGFETASLIRQRRSSAHTPIIFITSFSTADVEVYRGYSLGAVDYLFTPVTPEVLRSKVAVFVELAKKNREIQRQAEAIRRAEEERMQRKLDETNARLEWETRRNHFSGSRSNCSRSRITKACSRRRTRRGRKPWVTARASCTAARSRSSFIPRISPRPAK